MRGGLSPEISLARYAPEGNSNFYGFAPLDFKPAPGEWYTVRVAVAGNRFQVYLNDDALPRLNVEIKNNPWPDGGVALGGGWLPTEFSDFKVEPLTGDKRAAFQAVGDQTWAPPAVDKEALRARQRAAYQPAKIDAFAPARTEVPLNGQWLFMPEQSLDASQPPIGADVPDENWHVIPVPSYWTPSLGWLHGEEQKQFGPKSPSNSRGPSDLLVMEEYDRVNAQTFDWEKTKVGWYRHYLDLPQDLAGRQFELVFDAIAKISDIWVNGAKVGSHVGMFGEVDCDITQAVKPGHNVIAVRVVGIPNSKIKDANKVEGVAVTMEVTAEALQSLPHGMSDDHASGIWQPVKLVVTNPVRVGEVYIQPKLDGASAQVEILNGDSRDHSVVLSYAIRGAKDPLDANPKAAMVTVPANGKVMAQIDTPKLQPKLWSPAEPNLYTLDLQVGENAKMLDEQKIDFGFRTFTVEGNKLMLNGKPYWLRGGNHFPVTLRPNDDALARKFIGLARDGNVRITRSHAIPFTEVWFKAADELGMGVSYEGTWPWLMLKGEPPPADVLAVWKSEFTALMHKYRNHPSLLFWTVNNEMNFATFDQKNKGLLTRKWVILDDMIKAMRQTDPTRPVVAYSGYRRSDAQKGFDEVVTPNHFDDGDIDDSHSYFGWYNPSFFHFFNGEYGKTQALPNRPLISQEMSTGYPRDDGWPSRSYEFTRYVPEALVGNYAFEGNDPSIFLIRHAFMTKELAEVIRRTNRDEAAGVMHFAYLTWFTHVWKVDEIQPAPAYYELKKALQPVLVSAELFGRHFYAGDNDKRRVCLANDADDEQAVPAGKLTWEIRDGTQVLAQGSQDSPGVPYYANQWLDVNFQMPAALPRPRVDAKLVLSLVAGGQTLSTNDYDIVLATREWAGGGAAAKVQVFDPSGGPTATLAGLNAIPVASLDQLSAAQPLVVGDLAGLMRGLCGSGRQGPAPPARRQLAETLPGIRQKLPQHAERGRAWCYDAER